MSIKPAAGIKPNTLEFENRAVVKPTGFREYDARWWFGIPGHEKEPEINLYGIQALGEGLGTLMYERGVQPKIAVGHDFRHYSLSIKQALIVGLMNAGVEVLDIGLALSPMAYFAQFALDCPGVAMVTASHNHNGWTGVKMGIEAPLTFGPDEMSRLKQIVLGGESRARPGGRYQFVDGVRDLYLADLCKNIRLKKKIKVVAACGNGTAGAFAPHVLDKIGAEVVPINCNLDYTFPAYNPNPEDLKMLHAMRDAVLKFDADIAVGFDGDGDRCGVVDNEGEEIFADKVGVMLARDLSELYPNTQFVADVKSTGLYMTDPVLIKNGAKTDYYKTGHSYIKRRSKEIGALVGFEKSGHYFFNSPIGRGYDDGIISAIAILQMLDRNPSKTMADLRRDLPTTYGSPTMSPYCADEEKYGVVDQVVKEYEDLKASGGKIMGMEIRDLVTVNGVRVVLEDGTWGLVRASSNTPNLVVVVESPTSEDNKIGMFREIESRLGKYDEIGEYDQKI
ncbi:MAG: phosphomannomutase/phosphoglucomutase [Hellea sp.]|nr:phosphomannomutase/phosphoglucomutase [Hellea sp.]